MSTVAKPVKSTKVAKTSAPAPASASASVAPAPSYSPAPVPAPAAPKVSRKKEAAASASASAASAPAVVAAAVPASASASASDAPAAASSKDDVSVQLLNTVGELHDQLTALKAAFSVASSTVKSVQKQAENLAKKLAGRRRKNKAELIPGAPPKACIFTRDVKVSAELCAFLNRPKDTAISRSSVTKGVIKYAKDNNLMNKQSIVPDAALRKLLSLNEGDALSILNLQKYLSGHYTKTVAVAPSAPAVPASSSA
jgi:chromatin remodeling complex protein RSC6